MPISSSYDAGDYSLILNVAEGAPTSGQRLDAIVDGLFEALEIIRERLHDKKIYSFGLDVTGIHNMDDEFDPSREEMAAAWVELINEERLRSRFYKWINELVRLYSDAENIHGDLWEGGNWQLGELVSGELAMADVKFVPLYARLIRKFDLRSKGNINDLIEDLIEKHGACTEIDELLIVWAADREQAPNLRHLLPALQKLYGEFKDSRCFLWMVKAIYKKEKLEWVAYDAFRPFEFKPAFFDESLDEAAENIVVELEAEASKPQEPLIIIAPPA